MSREKQIEEMRIGCPMRHENGNCLVAGGFCTAVNTPIYEALHNAYDTGKMHSMEEMKKQGYRKQVVDANSATTTGEWKNNHCTNCGMMPMGEEMWTRLDLTPPRFEWFMNYCPNCGAKMKGGAE